VLPVRASTAQAPSQIFIAMHWGQEVLTGQDPQGQALTGINGLTNPAFCPQSKQPELKQAAISIDKLDLPWRLTAMAWLPADEALAVREQLRPALASFAFASLLPFGREPDPQGRLGLLLRAAAGAAPQDSLLAPLRQALQLDAPGVLAYCDPHRGQQRALRVARDASGAERLQGFWVAGDVSGEAWLRTLLEADQSLPGPGRQLLAPGALASRSVSPRSPQICTCFNISQAQIEAGLAQCTGRAEARVLHLQSTLRCGTQCGSCLPSLRRMAQASCDNAGTQRHSA
jgi:assimilatory nitrate reductase catalytic subunit